MRQYLCDWIFLNRALTAANDLLMNSNRTYKGREPENDADIEGVGMNYSPDQNIALLRQGSLNAYHDLRHLVPNATLVRPTVRELSPALSRKGAIGKVPPIGN